ncbi:MAG: hypothetical protein QM528_00510 [Phycisphaerales bacterium]|nr:hypothetical protein [Phycisphaerales bacterium]
MKINIALVTGGYSGEAVISYRSADRVVAELNSDKYDVYKIDINTAGWFCLYKNEKYVVDKNDFTVIIDDKRIMFQLAFMCLHGTPAEDGKLLGYFDMIGMPYTCSGSSVSALLFNKGYAVARARTLGIAVASSISVYRDSCKFPIKHNLRFPLIVKPTNGGSSLGGIAKVWSDTEITAAVTKVFQGDNAALVEEFVEGREFTIGVYQYQAHIVTLPPTELVRTGTFFTFDEKYSGKGEEITPAHLDEQLLMALNSLAIFIYQSFQCSGLVRIDFIHDVASKQWVMLEINTIPGLTATSLVPQQVLATGMTLSSFYDRLIEDALR